MGVGCSQQSDQVTTCTDTVSTGLDPAFRRDPLCTDVRLSRTALGQDQQGSAFQHRHWAWAHGRYQVAGAKAWMMPFKVHPLKARVEMTCSAGALYLRD